ncbi:hypothetical protein ACFE04_011663 [Oxalis oulophora]
MALRLMIRRACSNHRALISLNRGGVATKPNHLIISSRCFCTDPIPHAAATATATATAADEELLRAIQSEIKTKLVNNKEKEEHEEEEDIPFVMHSLDNTTILMKREFNNEEIQFWMDKNDLNPQTMFEALVKIDKTTSDSSLYFRIYVYPDKEIEINKVSYGPKIYKDRHGQTIVSCGEDLQKAFLSYLSLRGINTELFNSLRSKMSVLVLNDIHSFLQS